MAKSQVPITGPARCSVPPRCPRGLRWRTRCFRLHEVGNHRLQRGVVDRPPSALIDTTRIRSARVMLSSRIGMRRPDRHGAYDVRDGHERAPPETVGEGAGRQRQDEPGQAVGSDDGGHGQGVRIDHHRHERDRSGDQPVPGAGQREADPEPWKGRPRRFLRMRCSPDYEWPSNLRICPRPVACHATSAALRMLASDLRRDSGGRPPQQKKLLKAASPPCRESQWQRPVPASGRCDYYFGSLGESQPQWGPLVPSSSTSFARRYR